MSSPGQDPNVTRIGLDVHSVEQLFSTFDPSPFHEFSLNSTAAQYVASEAWYAPRRNRFVIELGLRGKPADRRAVARLGEVLREHFRRAAATEAQNLRKLLRTGLISLAIGLVILAICTALARAVDGAPLPDGWREGIRDGISVFGWVANWRPAEILFYDWWPLRRSRNLYRRLAEAEVVAAQPSPHSPTEEAAALDTMPIEAGGG
ncbi:hypothetical protein [Phreatobacter sp. AB_2022a]|uniref:hypothetical protein n=1 Tax=Phreatobacter sp. AB_2022a TaxID=3003134 RepID=UPI00228756CE|nr:hypothetical protein [Phreatobacter sp. AB_2022a]MCZ0733496.1 hypothetical protein [Phreatobacter sp. AB_2022a]